MFFIKCCPFNSHKLCRIMLGLCLNTPSEVAYESNCAEVKCWFEIISCLMGRQKRRGATQIVALTLHSTVNIWTRSHPRWTAVVLKPGSQTVCQVSPTVRLFGPYRIGNKKLNALYLLKIREFPTQFWMSWLNLKKKNINNRGMGHISQLFHMAVVVWSCVVACPL